MSKFTLSAFADEAARDLSGQLAALKLHGIKQIEVRGIDGVNIIDKTEGELEAIAQQIRDSGISVSAIGSPIGKIDIAEDFQATKERFAKALSAAKLLCTDKIRMFSFYMDDCQKAAYRDEVLRRLDWLSNESQKQGILCCHENEQGIYGDTFERCLDIHKNTGVGCVFDAANYIMCGESPFEFFAELLPYVTYMHIKDADIATREIMPCGGGSGNIAGMLQLLNTHNKQCVLSLEPHLSVFDGLASLQHEELRHSHIYATQAEAFAAAVSALKNTLDKKELRYE